MSKYSRVLVFGSIAKDEIMSFPGKLEDHFNPEMLHQINVSFAIDRLNITPGGTATNICYSLSQFIQPSKVSILGGLGKDGDYFEKFFEDLGLETSYLVKDDKLYCSTGKCITDKVDNQIWGFYYGAAAVTNKIKLTPDLASESLLIISSNHINGVKAMIDQAIDYKIDYMFDPGMMLSFLDPEILTKGCLNCKYLIGNDYEIAKLLEVINLSITELNDKGVIVITTLGAKGVRYQDKQQTLEVPGVKVAQVVDPTGAGDAFRGGFVAGLMHDLSLEDCLKQGNTIGSKAVMHMGGNGY